MKERESEHVELQFSAFPNARALEVGMRIVELANENGYAVTVDIRKHGQQIFHYACEGTSRDNDAWIIRKNNTADYFGKSSLYIKEMLKEQKMELEELSFIDSREYSAFGGAFPIYIKETGMIGTVTVSGLPDEQDHGLVVSVLREFIRKDSE